MEQREIVSSEDFHSKGTHGKSIKFYVVETPDSASKKKLEEAKDFLGIDYKVTNEDVEIYDHKNFQLLNILAFVSASAIKSELLQKMKLLIVKNPELADLSFKNKVDYIQEVVINEAANNIYNKLSSKYTIKTHVKETTLMRLKCTILSYIVLIGKTIKEIKNYKKTINKAYRVLHVEDNFQQLLAGENEKENNLGVYENKENVEEIVESVSIQSDEDEEGVYESEIKNKKGVKIIKFKEEGVYMTVERFVNLLEDLAFLGTFVDAIKNTFDYCTLEFTPFTSEDFSDKIFEMVAIKTKEREANVKEFGAKLNSKTKNTVVTFRKGKNVYVIPKPIKNENFTYDEIYSSPFNFCENGADLQREDFFKSLSNTIKNNIQSINNICISSEDTKWFHFAISDNKNIYSYANYTK